MQPLSLAGDRLALPLLWSPKQWRPESRHLEPVAGLRWACLVLSAGRRWWRPRGFAGRWSKTVHAPTGRAGFSGSGTAIGGSRGEGRSLAHRQSQCVLLRASDTDQDIGRSCVDRGRFRSNRCRASEFCGRCSGRTLTATSRSERVSVAQYTSPIPPAPSGETISCGLSFVLGSSAIRARIIAPRGYTRIRVQPANSDLALWGTVAIATEGMLSHVGASKPAKLTTADLIADG